MLKFANNDCLTGLAVTTSWTQSTAACHTKDGLCVQVLAQHMAEGDAMGHDRHTYVTYLHTALDMPKPMWGYMGRPKRV